MATSSVTDVQGLKEKKAQAEQAFNALNNDPKFQALRSQAATNFNEYKKLSAEADAAFKAGNTELSSTLSAQSVQALQKNREIDSEYLPQFKQLQAYQAEYKSYESQIANTATTPTAPTPPPQEQTDKATTAGNDAAKGGSPQPPVKEPDLPPVAPFNPAPSASPPNNTPTDVELLNTYNDARKDLGLPGLTINDPAAREFIQEQRIDFQEADPFPFIQQPNTTLTPEQNGEFISSEFKEFQNEIVPADPLASERSSDFGATLTASSEDVALLDLTAGSGQPNPNLVASKNILNNGQKAAYGSGAKDWRFRVSLASTANYLYKASPAGILQPLQATDGVIFPYTPAINITYSASYNAVDLTHTNYKIYNYHNSAVENVSITGDFTAQDSAEANYLLAVIHFFKSVTKMFYGQDQNPSRGIPPPLVYLSGFGQYQFDRHPCVITNFTYNMPVDVDYINAYPTNNSSAVGGVNMQPFMPQIAKWNSPLDRLRTLTSKIQPGGLPPAPVFQRSQNINEITRVPTKITIQLTAIPIVTRNAISNQFSLKKYATGELMRGSVNPKAGGGIW